MEKVEDEATILAPSSIKDSFLAELCLIFFSQTISFFLRLINLSSKFDPNLSLYLKSTEQKTCLLQVVEMK